MAFKNKLFSLTSPEFRMPSFLNRDGSVSTQSGNNIPMVCWPDGTWCFEASMYLLECFEKNLSRRHNGGTLAAYASNLSHLLRYCFSNNISLCSLTDNRFTHFINSLIAERNPKYFNQPLRSSNAVLIIGRRSLEFLKYVGDLNSQSNYVCEQGVIRAFKKYFKMRKSSGKLIVHAYLTHNSFPHRSPKKKRLPISTADIEKLMSAASTHTYPFIRRRRFVLIKLLELTGGRRSEAAAITVQSVYDADNTPRGEIPVLAIPILKGADRIRYVPISRHDIRYLLDFIAESRNVLIRKKFRSKSPSDTLLISATTGLALKPNTITQEIHILAKLAKLLGQICPHMFRHRFITNVLKILFEHYGLAISIGDFKMLMSLETIKEKALDWTGHRSTESLEPYIHLAQSEMTNSEKMLDLISLQRSLDSCILTLKEHLLEAKKDPVANTEKAMRLLELIMEEVSSARSKHAVNL